MNKKQNFIIKHLATLFIIFIVPIGLCIPNFIIKKEQSYDTHLQIIYKGYPITNYTIDTNSDKIVKFVDQENGYIYSANLSILYDNSEVGDVFKATRTQVYYYTGRREFTYKIGDKIDVSNDN